MAYEDIYRLQSEELVLRPLTVAVASVAKDVFTEDAQTPAHDVRMALVNYAGPRTAEFRRFAQEIALIVLVLNPTLGVDSADQAYYDAVSGIWTAYAQLLAAKGSITVAV